MKPRLEKWQHSAISVGLLLIVLSLLYAVLILPAVSGRGEFQEHLQEMQFQYTKLTDSVRQIESLKSELKRLQAAQTNRAGFLEEKPLALAAADLQKHIKTLIETNGGNLVSTQVIHKRPGSDDAEPFPEVSIKVHMRAEMSALQGILYRLASEQPVLMIRELYLQSRVQPAGRRSRPDNYSLEARFDVTGFLYQSASS